MPSEGKAKELDLRVQLAILDNTWDKLRTTLQMAPEKKVVSTGLFRDIAGEYRQQWVLPRNKSAASKRTFLERFNKRFGHLPLRAIRLRHADSYVAWRQESEVEIAGLGNIRTSYWTLPTDIYPTAGKNVEVYGYKYPIQDCRSGVCYPGYLWWNGYIPANRINSVDANRRPNGVMGVPTDFEPAAQPLIPAGSTALPPNAPANTVVSQYWDTNSVWIPLSNGTVQRVIFNDNLHPWRNQYMPGVRQWFQDASLFKFIKITEQMSLRLNVDFFNVFNHPNNPTAIGGDGVLLTRNSGSAARVTQVGLRLIW